MNPVLMISEKPDAAQKIASALADKGTIIEEKINKTRYYWFKRDKKNYLVLPAVGHLFTLRDLEKGKWTYPVFDNEWVPVFEAEKSAYYAKQYYDNFADFSKKFSDVIVCTDYDNEGSVIAYNILRFILKRKTAKRMFFTTLTKEELNESFEEMKEDADKGMINAGLARHNLDWMYGVNLTRALTLALKKSRNGFYLLSTGRVQGPTLKILCEKEKEINDFVPKDYWSISAKWEKDYLAEYKEGRIFEKKVADKVFAECKNEKKGVVKDVKTTESAMLPPHPFSLTSLQSECYNQFKYNPYLTQQIAQKLYINALISYPRTSSEKLPEKIGFKKILEKLSKQDYYKKFCQELLALKSLKPNEGKKDDSAHTAIYPTGEFPKRLSIQEKNVYDLIVKRFLSTFKEPGVKESTKIIFDIKSHLFSSNGSVIIKKGWVEFYGKYYKPKDVILPKIKEGDFIKINEVLNEKKQTEPPNRYSHSGIVGEMEKRGIGTKATRAAIVKTLDDRGYISGESIKVTKLGIGVNAALKKYCPRIISEDLTKKFEENMELIAANKETKENVMIQAQEILIDISNEFKENEEKIGKKLSEALEESWKEQSNVGKKMGKCPKCSNDLVIMYSKKNGEEFIGCSKYPECETTYSVPKCEYESLEKNCKICKAPKVLISKNKYEFCLNNNCPSRVAGICPECKSNLRAMYSKRGSRFIGCGAFPKCKKLYPLPSKGEIEFTKKECKKCGSPLIIIDGAESCLNKECK
ncbi:MAG: DNA topoisomerase I [Candidatus Nanoarchaeia archaeon]|nr:DNA topoisomerase I [Candidatus Nanoarchaeia archaeon]